MPVAAGGLKGVWVSKGTYRRNEVTAVLTRCEAIPGEGLCCGGNSWGAGLQGSTSKGHLAPSEICWGGAGTDHPLSLALPRSLWAFSLLTPTPLAFGATCLCPCRAGPVFCPLEGSASQVSLSLATWPSNW